VKPKEKIGEKRIMREIKFRTFDKKYKIMLDPEDISISSKYRQWLGIVDTQNIMQYTGLKDVNGKEIYDGDIAKYITYNDIYYSHKNNYEFKINQVMWGETGDSDGWLHDKHYEWIIGNDSLADVADSCYADKMYFEIIGNIYENPELLEDYNESEI
jgi:uncharacterized phage protein (TIGR01671 family)